MRDRSFQLIFRGVRGSVPVTRAAGGAYGGNTTCLEIGLGPDHRLLIDCGSGLADVAPPRQQARECRFDVLLTHYHLDHLIGLPSFKPLYDRRSRFTFYGVGWKDQGVHTTLDRFLGPPWFPVSFLETGSEKRFVDLELQPVELPGLRITCARLHHPQGVTAYRLEHDGRSVVFATDHEAGDPEADRRLRALAEGADVLIHDAQYTPDEYDRHHRGWGHSSWSHAVEAARAAGVGRLILFHHDPERTDDEIDSIVEVAARSFPAVAGAREGMSLAL